MDAGIVERQRIMSTVWVHAAAGCAAIASWLYKAPSRHDSRLPGEEPAVAHDIAYVAGVLASGLLDSPGA